MPQSIFVDLFFLVNSTGESIYAFDIIARFFPHNQHYSCVFVIQKQFSVRYRMDLFIVRNVTLGIFFGVPREREKRPQI